MSVTANLSTFFLQLKCSVQEHVSSQTNQSIPEIICWNCWGATVSLVVHLNWDLGVWGCWLLSFLSITCLVLGRGRQNQGWHSLSSWIQPLINQTDIEGEEMQSETNSIIEGLGSPFRGYTSGITVTWINKLFLLKYRLSIFILKSKSTDEYFIIT